MNKQTKNFIVVFFFSAAITNTSLYAYRFGLGLWEMPDEWADLGSYVGGIYTPILSLITLAVISVQIFIQNQQFQHSFDPAPGGADQGISSSLRGCSRYGYW